MRFVNMQFTSQKVAIYCTCKSSPQKTFECLFPAPCRFQPTKTLFAQNPLRSETAKLSMFYGASENVSQSMSSSEPFSMFAKQYPDFHQSKSFGTIYQIYRGAGNFVGLCHRGEATATRCKTAGGKVAVGRTSPVVACDAVADEG